MAYLVPRLRAAVLLAAGSFKTLRSVLWLSARRKLALNMSLAALNARNVKHAGHLLISLLSPLIKSHWLFATLGAH